MDARGLVALVLSITLPLTICLRAVLAYAFPEVITPAENLTLWMDLFNTLVGGLLVYIGTRIDK